MNEEEKDAIEQLKSWREYIINHKEKVNKANDIEFYIRTVLNLIEKLQEENKVFKRALDEETADRSNDLLELQKKDKMIDLMAEELQTHMFVVSVGKTIIGKKGIKEYYEQKAKEGGE